MAPLCTFYLQGKCKYGISCRNLHPEQLSLDTQPKTDYKVSDAIGEACQRCLGKNLACDKASRPREDDPCPECRWFTGETGTCILAASVSRNEQMFKQMAASSTHTLPASKPRDEPVRNRRKTGPPKPAEPMPANRVRADWTGPTRTEVLNTPDMLPVDVRERPWLYCKVSGETFQQFKKKTRQAIYGNNEKPVGEVKRERTGTTDPEDVQPAAQRAIYQVPQVLMPPRDPLRGDAEELVLRFDKDGSTVSAMAKYPAVGGHAAVDVVYHRD